MLGGRRQNCPRQGGTSLKKWVRSKFCADFKSNVKLVRPPVIMIVFVARFRQFDQISEYILSILSKKNLLKSMLKRRQMFGKR